MRAWNIVKLCVGLPLIGFIASFWLLGFSEDVLRMNIRLTARLAAIYFALAFMASSVQYFKKGLFTFWWLSNRKFLGISFALMHFIHFAFLLILQNKYHPVFQLADITSLLAGGIGYLFIVLMFFTSFDYFKKWITQDQWKTLHTIGSFWIAGVFISSYIKRVDTEMEYFPLLLLLVLTVILNFAKFIYKHFKAN